MVKKIGVKKVDPFASAPVLSTKARMTSYLKLCLKVHTWFGVDIVQVKTFFRVRVPAFYQNEMFGVCMNCNKDKYDDYMKKDGTILPFPSQHGYKLG